MAMLYTRGKLIIVTIYKLDAESKGSTRFRDPKPEAVAQRGRYFGPEGL